MHTQFMLFTGMYFYFPRVGSFLVIGEQCMEFAMPSNLIKEPFGKMVGYDTIYHSTLPETQESDAGVATSHKAVAFPSAWKESPQEHLSLSLELA